MEAGIPCIQIWNTFTFNDKIKNLSFTLQREMFTLKKNKSQFLGSLRVFQKEIWLTLRAIWYSLLPSSVKFLSFYFIPKLYLH